MGTTSVLSVTTSLRCAAAGQPGVAMSSVERLFTQAAVVGEGAQLSTLTLLRIPPQTQLRSLLRTLAPAGRSIVAGLKAACRAHHVGFFCYGHRKIQCCNDYGHFV